MLAFDQNLVTINVPECPLCNQTGEIRYTGLRDAVWFAPGEWTYRACSRCGVLWLDPRPTSECFNLIYPQDYLTHSEPTDSLSKRSSFLADLKLKVKFGVLCRAYNYSLSSSIPAISFVGMVAAYVPGIKRWAGYTVRFLPAREGHLLDVGCGNGEFILTMSNLGWNVWGIEPDSVSASICHRAGLKIYEGSIESAPLKPNSFDAITMNHVIEHIPDPVGALRKLSDALRPEGWLVSISPNPSSMLARRFDGTWRGLEPPRHFVLLSPRALASISQQVGLEPAVWTTARSSEWMARESLSIFQYGNTTTYKGRLLPRLIAIGCKVLTVLKGDLGEEVILIARKK